MDEEYEEDEVYPQHGGDLVFQAHTLQGFRAVIADIGEKKVEEIMKKIPAEREAKTKLQSEIEELKKKLEEMQKKQTAEEKIQYQ